MKRLLLLATVCYLLVPAAAASAHPLGNFTINRFARVEIAGDRLYVRYVVDMAEIPTLQRVPVRIGALHITVDGRPVRSSTHVAPRASTRRGSRRSSPAPASRTLRPLRLTTGTTPIGSAGRRSSSARRPARPRASCGHTRRTCSAARSTSRTPRRLSVRRMTRCRCS
jgi:hypothetical protein